MHNGVPFDVAFGLEDTERAGYCIIMTEFQGRRFDWNTMEFKDE